MCEQITAQKKVGVIINSNYHIAFVVLYLSLYESTQLFKVSGVHLVVYCIQCMVWIHFWWIYIGRIAFDIRSIEFVQELVVLDLQHYNFMFGFGIFLLGCAVVSLKIVALFIPWLILLAFSILLGCIRIIGLTIDFLALVVILWLITNFLH